MMASGRAYPVQILLVEDNPGDIRLIREAMLEGRFYNPPLVAKTGEEALAILRNRDSVSGNQQVDLILLDLNLPGLNGIEVLREIKTDPETSRIPVVILTSSQAEEDVVQAYDQYANCYITKPVDMDGFLEIVQSIEQFWISVVKLPGKDGE